MYSVPLKMNEVLSRDRGYATGGGRDSGAAVSFGE